MSEEKNNELPSEIKLAIKESLEELYADPSSIVHVIDKNEMEKILKESFKELLTKGIPQITADTLKELRSQKK